MEAVAATFDISPPHYLPTACHGKRDRSSRSIAVPLEANLIALREGGEILVLVSLDWFFVSPEMRCRILQHCDGRLGERNLIVAASHTHTSPNTDTTKVGFSRVYTDYVGRVEQTVAEKVRQMLDENQWNPVTLRYAVESCDLAIHRRRKVWWPSGGRLRRMITNYPNPEGPTDRELRLLRVESADGALLAVLWGVSCHPTEWPNTEELSSDFPGLVRNALRSRIHAAVPVLFLQGFCGDLRPPALGRWARRASTRVRLGLIVSSLVNGPFFAGWSARHYHHWVEKIQRSAVQALEKAAVRQSLDSGLVVSRVVAPLSAIGLSGAIDEISFYRVDLGTHLRLLAVSAEIVWEYAAIAREILNAECLWPIGYVDRVYGYLPTEPMLSEGGYECSGFLGLFAMEGRFLPETEQVVRSCIAALLSDKQTAPADEPLAHLLQ